MKSQCRRRRRQKTKRQNKTTHMATDKSNEFDGNGMVAPSYSTTCGGCASMSMAFTFATVSLHFSSMCSVVFPLPPPKSNTCKRSSSFETDPLRRIFSVELLLLEIFSWQQSAKTWFRMSISIIRWTSLKKSATNNLQQSRRINANQMPARVTTISDMLYQSPRAARAEYQTRIQSKDHRNSRPPTAAHARSVVLGG